MQLGAHSSCGQCVRSVVRTEGITALWRSLPVTLGTNIPFGAIFISTNDGLKNVLGVDTHAKSMDEAWKKLPT